MDFYTDFVDSRLAIIYEEEQLSPAPIRPEDIPNEELKVDEDALIEDLE